MKYVFSYKKRHQIFWRKQTVIGHKCENNRIDLFLEGGGVHSICGYNKTEIKLGSDWALAMKEDKSKQIGQQIP